MPTSALLESGYFHHPVTQIWNRLDSEPFSYSDGDGPENRLASILEQESDVSLFSPALKQHCIDWNTQYHLSQERANLLRPIEHLLRGDTLEIGAGCGAITRYLGELGGNIVALEGSERRAQIAALRTKDLRNVCVVCDSFNTFQTTRRFDAITLVGVLEYARIYGTGVDPVQEMLERARSLLKPSGILIVAIENQLGLKYLAGVPEDHVGQPMFGVQGLYTSQGVVTFGRYELENRLRHAGYQQIELALPFPDYKLPSSVVLPEGLTATPPFNPAVFAWQSVKRDRQVTKALNFSIESAWEVVGRNGLLAELANSFLFVASAKIGAKKFSSNVLAQHYTTERLPEFCKETWFLRNSTGNLEVRRHPLNTINGSNTQFEHQLSDEPFASGIPMDLLFIRKIATPHWIITDIAELMQRYIDILFAEASAQGYPPLSRNEKTLLPGDLLDVIPRNIHISEKGYTIIDCEWFHKSPITLGYAVFRALSMVTQMVSVFAEPEKHKWLNQRCFFESVFSALGLELKDTSLQDYLSFETKFQEAVHGSPCEFSLVEWSSFTFPNTLFYIPELHIQVSRNQILLKRQRLLLDNSQTFQFEILSPEGSEDSTTQLEIGLVNQPAIVQVSKIKMTGKNGEILFNAETPKEFQKMTFTEGLLWNPAENGIVVFVTQENTSISLPIQVMQDQPLTLEIQLKVEDLLHMDSEGSALLVSEIKASHFRIRELEKKTDDLKYIVDSAVKWQQRSWTTRAFHRWRMPKKC